MPVHEVTIDCNADQKSYHIRWRNLAAQTENAFAQSNHALTREAVEHLWLKPEYHHALGQNSFAFWMATPTTCNTRWMKRLSTASRWC